MTSLSSGFSGTPSRHKYGVAEGFTLLEMLVVVSVLSILSLLALHEISSSPGLDVRAAATGLAADLRGLRLLSMRQDQETSLQMGAHGYILRPSKKSQILPRGVSVTLASATPDLLEREDPVIRFFADGSSSGGTVEVDDRGARAFVRVRWIDGSVIVDAP